VVAGKKGSRELDVRYPNGQRQHQRADNVPGVKITTGTRDDA